MEKPRPYKGLTEVQKAASRKAATEWQKRQVAKGLCRCCSKNVAEWWHVQDGVVVLKKKTRHCIEHAGKRNETEKIRISVKGRYPRCSFCHDNPAKICGKCK